ncbi:MAG TPA: NAD-dependent epimerase/dehydratase family protein [Candidatus Binataceae bacterium]|jgi:nucleoside-diphosphate-sugar epimerase|nr:NAD-dependent epimerase/dehydratase family protein [Candidatus Binataceae bacterium]
MLVTGGTGFVGRHLVEELVRRGARVRVLGRRCVNRWRYQSAIELVRGDIGDAGVLESALDGVAGVYHLAAATAGDWDYYRRVTVEGSRRLLEILAARGGRALFVSSLSVYAGSAMTDGALIDEDFPIDDPAARGSYARAKTEADLIAQGYLSDPRIVLTIVRPGLIYGPGMKNPLPGTALSVTSRVWLVLGRGDKPLPLIHVRDAARMMIAIMNDGRAAGRTYNLVAPEMPTQNDYFNAYRRVYGRHPPLLRLPARSMILLLALSDRLLERPLGRDPRRRETLRRALSRVRYSGARLAAELGVRPEIGLERGLRLMAASAT